MRIIFNREEFKEGMDAWFLDMPLIFMVIFPLVFFAIFLGSFRFQWRDKEAV